MNVTASPTYSKISHPNQPGFYRMPVGCDKNIESALNYEARAGDVFICSYTKSGCTWLQNIVWRILHDGNGMTGLLRDSIPMLEFDGGEHFLKLPPAEGYKVVKTHFPYKWVPKHPQAKYILIIREPKDVCVSLYHHIKGFPTIGYNWTDGKFEDLVELFLKGEADCYDYFDMIDEWLQLEKSDSIHILLYEDLIADKRKEITRLGKFLSDKFEEKLLANNESLLDSIIENTSIARMKMEPKIWCKAERTTPFIRKGVVGDWKSLMTAEQAARFDKRTEKLKQKYANLKSWSLGNSV